MAELDHELGGQRVDLGELSAGRGDLLAGVRLGTVAIAVDTSSGSRAATAV
ncbi:MAG: hypothetical protein ACRDRX_14650 [Pseudonocardiaceae bacterium]